MDAHFLAYGLAFDRKVALSCHFTCKKEVKKLFTKDAVIDNTGFHLVIGWSMDLSLQINQYSILCYCIIRFQLNTASFYLGST